MQSSNENKQLKNIQGIPYRIRTTARTRRVLITVEPNGEVVVSKPARISVEKIERLLQEKIEWIKETVTKQKSRPQKLLAHYSVKDFKKYKTWLAQRRFKFSRIQSCKVPLNSIPVANIFLIL